MTSPSQSDLIAYRLQQADESYRSQLELLLYGAHSRCKAGGRQGGVYRGALTAGKNSDYGEIFTATQAEAAQSIKEAEDFVSAVKAYLQNI